MGKEESPILDKKSRNWLMMIGIFLILIIAVIIYFSVSAGGRYEEFAKCLTDKGVKMYGAYWCSHCQDQKSRFGSSFEYVNYIECSLPNRGGQNQECDNAGIQSYPTWEFSNGDRVERVLSLQELSQASGCPLTN